MSLASRSREIGRLLGERRQRIVFAESCTAGLVCTAMGQLPGISEFLCGSAVAYRDKSKERWLGVSSALLVEPGPVSAPVAAEMARGVLALTSEANLSAAVTGHLGPAAPPELDGHIYVAIAVRDAHDVIQVLGTHHHRLLARTRKSRQSEAAEYVLLHLGQALRGDSAAEPG